MEADKIKEGKYWLRSKKGKWIDRIIFFKKQTYERNKNSEGFYVYVKDNELDSRDRINVMKEKVLERVIEGKKRGRK